MGDCSSCGKECPFSKLTKEQLEKIELLNEKYQQGEISFEELQESVQKMIK